MSSYIPARSAFSRVFLIEGRARGDHTPSYKSCIRAGAVDQSFGDVERIECPTSDEYGHFEDIDGIQGAVDRATSDLQGRYAADEESDLLRLAKRRCALDVQVHFGMCTDPSDFDAFTKAAIFENARITNYSTEELGALSSDANAAVNETADLSAQSYYEVLPLSMAVRSPDVVDDGIADVVICDNPSCGDCDDESDGCEVILAIADGAGGVDPDLYWSSDNGATWTADPVTSFAAGNVARAIACVGNYVIVIDGSVARLHYKLLSEVLDGTAGNWTAMATGFVAIGRDIWSIGNAAWICGNSGYIYYTEDPTAGVTVIDAGVATSDILYGIHALDSENAVAVGANEAVVYTTNGRTFAAPTNLPLGTGIDLDAPWMKNVNEWWCVRLGTGGDAYFTTDAGASAWTTKTVSPGQVSDIQFATDSVAYACGDNSGGNSSLYRSINGGDSWFLSSGAQIITSGDSTALAACKHDPNFVVVVGLAAIPTDGFIAIGDA